MRVVLMRNLLAAFLFSILFFAASAYSVQAQLQPEPEKENNFGKLWKELEEGVTVPITGTHYYWHEGLNVRGADENLIFKIGGKVMIDYGRINADSNMKNALGRLWGVHGRG